MTKESRIFVAIYRMKLRKLGKFVIRRVLPILGTLLVLSIIAFFLFFDSIGQRILKEARRDLSGSLTVERFSPSFRGFRARKVKWRLTSDSPVFEADEMNFDIGFRELYYRDYYRSLEEVVVYQPKLRVVVDRAGNLNLRNLLPEADPDSIFDVTKIRSKITVRDGRILYRDLRDSGFIYQLTDVGGDILLADGESLDFDFLSRPEEAKESVSAVSPVEEGEGEFTLRGRISLKEPAFGIQLGLSKIGLSPLAGYPGFGPGLTMVRGLADGSLRVTGEGPSWADAFAKVFFVGDVSLVHGAFRHPRMPAALSDLKGKIVFLGTEISTEGFLGKFSGVPFTLTGKAEVGNDAATTAHLKVDKFPLGKLNELLEEPLPVSGFAEIDLRLRGTKDDYVASGHLQGEQLEVQDQRIARAQTDFLKSKDLVHLSNLRADTEAGQVSGEGWIFLGQEPRVLFEVQGQGANPDVLVSDFATSADFSVKVIGDPNDPVAYGEGTLFGLGSWSQGLQMAAGKFIFAGDDLLVFDGTARKGGSILHMPLGALNLKSQTFAGILQTLGFDAADVPGLQGVTGRFAGSAMVEADLSGETPVIEAQARLDSGDFSTGGLSVSGASGDILYDGSQVLLSGASGRFEGSQVEVSGTFDTRNQGVQMVLRSPRLNLGTFGLQGETADVTATVEGNLDGTLGIYGLAKSSHGKAALSAYQSGDGITRGVAWVDGEYQGVDVESTVVASGTLNDLNLEYNGHLDGAEFASVGPVDLFGSARLLGKTLNLRPTILAARDAPSDEWLYPLTTYSGAAYAFFGPLMSGPLEKVVIEESPFPKSRSLLLAGKADLGSGKLDLGFRLRAAGLEKFPMPEMVAELPFDLLSGFGQMGGTVGGTLSTPVVDARFLFPWLMLGDERDRRLTLGTRGNVQLAQRAMTVRGMTVSQISMDSRLSERLTEEESDGLLRVRGALTEGRQFDVRVKTDGFDPAFFAFFLPDISRSWFPSGRIATENLHLWGTLQEPNISGEVRLLGGGIMLAGAPYPIQSAVVDFSSQGGEIRIPRLELEAPGLALEGLVTRARNGSLSGTIQAQDVDLKRLNRFGGVFAGLDGEADLAINLGGSFPGTPQAELGVRTESVIWNPKVLGGRDQEVAIERFVLGRFDGDRLEEGLKVASGEDGLYVELPRNGFEFRRVYGGLSVAASGAVAFPTNSLTPYKTFDEWADYLASPWGPDFGRENQPFILSVDGLTTSEAAVLLGRDTQGVELATAFDLSLEGQWWRDHKKDAGTALPHYNLALREFTVESGEPGQRSGLQLDHTAELNYQRDGSVGYLDLLNWQFGFFRDLAGTEDEEITDPEDLILRQGVVDAQGHLAITSLPGAKPTSEFNLGAADIPLANLAFLLPAGVPLSGLVDSLEINLNGVLPTPKFSINGLISGFKIGGTDDIRIQGSLLGSLVDEAYRIVLGEGENEAITMTFGNRAQEDHSILLDGEAKLYVHGDSRPNPDRLELFAKNLTVSPDSPLDLRGELIDEDLEVLASILPGSEVTSGTFTGQLQVNGTLRRPEFEGHAFLENGRVDSKTYGRFENLQIDADMHRISADEATPSEVLEDAASGFLTRLEVAKFEGTLGGKPFFGGGLAEFAGVSPTFLDLFFTGESLPVKLPELFTGQVDIDLELIGKTVVKDGLAYLQPILQGLLIIPQGELKIPLGSATDISVAEKAPKSPIDLSVLVSLGKEFYVKAMDSEIRAVGDLKIESQEGATQIFGRADLSRGLIQIPFYDSTFRVRQGVAVFDGPLIPRLEDVEAVTDLGGYRITARANGRYPDTLKLDLYSDPPLPQSELNRVAVLGGLPPQLTGMSDPNQTSSSLGSLSNQGVSFLSGILTNRLTDKIGKFLFLSELSFDYIPPATYAIKIAKALDPEDRFLLTLTRIIRDNGLNENLYGVEWRFTRTLLVRVAFDQLSRMRLWFQSINRF